MRKTFKSNEKYFKFINKNKRLIDIISVNIKKNTIKLVYEKKDEPTPEQLQLDMKKGW